MNIFKRFGRFSKRGASVMTLLIFAFSLVSVFFIVIPPVSACACDLPFITTWKTDNAGSSSSTAITIPTTGGGYNYDVYWGDASSTSGVTGNVTHNYDDPGTYTVIISGTFPQIDFLNGGDRQKIVSVEQWGTGVWRSMYYAFHGATNLVINATDAPDLSSVTNMSGMFFNASSMNTDISAWDVSHVGTMTVMFQGATSFNQPLSSWNVANVSIMSGMFVGATSFNQPLNSWNTASLADINNMFDGATAFNQPLSNWNVSHVFNMSNMFKDATAFDQDLSAWNVTTVSDMRTMFSGARLSTSNYNALLNSWAAQSVHANVPFSGGSSVYCDAASSARASLIANHSWTITDGGICSDIIAPVISRVGSDNVLVIQNSSYTDAGATATDVRDGNLTSSIVTTGSVNTAVPGTFTITYNVSDNAHNAATPVTRTVNVIALGGGGFTSVTPASNDDAPLSVVVNNQTSGTVTTNDAIVALAFNAGNTVKGFAISLSPDFVNVGIQNYIPNTTFVLPKPGSYSVYVKFYSLTGNSSEVIQRTVVYAPTGTNTKSVDIKKSKVAVFLRTLKLGSRGADVLALQKFLNYNGFVVAKTGAGSVGNENSVFGPATAKAVAKFQEANAATILKPYNLTKGTGVFGPASIKIANSITN